MSWIDIIKNYGLCIILKVIYKAPF